jgi:hypothetical protein
MSVDVMEWDDFANSSRGLLARPILPNNVIALREHIATITYKAYNKTDGGAPVTGSLDPAEVMLTAPSGKNTWSKDQIGYTFLWPAPGTIWDEPGKLYQIVLTFTTTVALGSKSFDRVYKVTTFDPAEV